MGNSVGASCFCFQPFSLWNVDYTVYTDFSDKIDIDIKILETHNPVNHGSDK